MSQEIIYMTEKELLDMPFAFIFHVEKSEDMYIPIGYREIGFIGQHKEFNQKLDEEYDKCQGWFPYRNENGNHLKLFNHYTKSTYCEYYGKSTIFDKQTYIDTIITNLPIVLVDGNYKKYYYVIDNEYNFKAFSNENVAKASINSETRDIFFGNQKCLKLFIKELKKLDKTK